MLNDWLVSGQLSTPCRREKPMGTKETGVIDDAQMNHARQLMVEFEAGVGTSDGLEKVSK